MRAPLDDLPWNGAGGGLPLPGPLPRLAFRLLWLILALPLAATLGGGACALLLLADPLRHDADTFASAGLAAALLAVPIAHGAACWLSGSRRPA